MLAHPRTHHLHGALVDRVREPAWDHDLLMSLLASDRWCPSLLAPVPQRVPVEPREALAAVADGDEEVAGRDLEMLRRIQPDQPRWERTTPPS